MSDQMIQVIGSLIMAVFVVRGAWVWSRRFWPRDPQRLFTADQKRFLRSRAGHRCEHHWVGFLRCPRRDRLHADHIMPWSRGGRTSIANGQMLCRRHNLRKSNRIPSLPYRWRLAYAHRHAS